MLASENSYFGFYGTFDYTSYNADEAWGLALSEIATQSKTKPEGARLFLDSRLGRHFADDVITLLDNGTGLEQAIKITTEQWQTPKLALGFGCLPAYSLHAQITEMLAA